MRCAPVRWCTPREVHAHEVHAREAHVDEVHARKVHAHEIHACEMHAHETHALETHARKVLGKISRSSTLQTVIDARNKCEEMYVFLAIDAKMQNGGNVPRPHRRVGCLYHE
jgi:hypothetical protein